MQHSGDTRCQQSIRQCLGHEEKGPFRFKVYNLHARERLEIHGREIERTSQMNLALFP